MCVYETSRMMYIISNFMMFSIIKWECELGSFHSTKAINFPTLLSWSLFVVPFRFLNQSHFSLSDGAQNEAARNRKAWKENYAIYYFPWLTLNAVHNGAQTDGTASDNWHNFIKKSLNSEYIFSTQCSVAFFNFCHSLPASCCVRVVLAGAEMHATKNCS